MLRSVAVPLGMHAVATRCRRRALSRVISDPCRGSMGTVPRGSGSDARRTTPVAAVPGGWLEWRCSGLSAKDGIALTAERYPKYNTIGAEVDTSRPFQKLLNQRVIGTCHMTPTIHQSSAPIARPRLSELSRQVAVDFQPDADFDERRRCPGHRLLPFVGQYHSRSSAYRGGVRIQEIKIIAFVYDPGSRFHPDLSGRPTGIVLPRQHAAPHDDPAGARGESSSEFAPLAQPIHCGKHPPTEGTARRRVSSAGRRPSRSVFQTPDSLVGRLRNEVMPLSPFAKAIPNFSPVFQRHCFDAAAPYSPDANSPCTRSAFLTSARPPKLAKGRSCK
jgi:hypothetical protein